MIETFTDGILISTEYYRNGKLKQLIPYNADGYEQGLVFRYFENGQNSEKGIRKKHETFFENGQISSKANQKGHIIYYPNGQIRSKTTYNTLFNKYIITQYFDENGALLSQNKLDSKGPEFQIYRRRFFKSHYSFFDTYNLCITTTCGKLILEMKTKKRAHNLFSSKK